MRSYCLRVNYFNNMSENADCVRNPSITTSTSSRPRSPRLHCSSSELATTALSLKVRPVSLTFALGFLTESILTSGTRLPSTGISVERTMARETFVEVQTRVAKGPVMNDAPVMLPLSGRIPFGFVTSSNEMMGMFGSGIKASIYPGSLADQDGAWRSVLGGEVISVEGAEDSGIVVVGAARRDRSMPSAIPGYIPSPFKTPLWPRCVQIAIRDHVIVSEVVFIEMILDFVSWMQTQVVLMHPMDVTGSTGPFYCLFEVHGGVVPAEFPCIPEMILNGIGTVVGIVLAVWVQLLLLRNGEDSVLDHRLGVTNEAHVSADAEVVDLITQGCQQKSQHIQEHLEHEAKESYGVQVGVGADVRCGHVAVDPACTK
ncbi:hypothetical protein B0H13DRAFT_1888555 [Mycena leptocephala]|nr:hypothetical protein B0H13DRAFT_1888555 [Mycena leptocephala]